MASQETDAIVRFVSDAGLADRITSIDDGVHANGSYHKRFGTPSGLVVVSPEDRPGRGLAVDIAEPRPSNDTPGLLAIAREFLKVEAQLAELIYFDLDYYVKLGKRVGKYDVSPDSHDHVHVAVERGVILRHPSVVHPLLQEENMVAQDIISAGTWVTDSAGHIYAFDGAPYLGNLTDHPSWNAGSDVNPSDPCVGIAPWKGDGTDANGNGYVLACRVGTAVPTLYRFPRSGVYVPH